MNRKDAKVSICGNVNLIKDAITSIRIKAAGYGIYVDTEEVASCLLAKRLADWAFSRGALSVRHDYDLARSDWEP